MYFCPNCTIFFSATTALSQASIHPRNYCNAKQSPTLKKKHILSILLFLQFAQFISPNCTMYLWLLYLAEAGGGDRGAFTPTNGHYWDPIATHHTTGPKCVYFQLLHLYLYIKVLTYLFTRIE